MRVTSVALAVLLAVASLPLRPLPAAAATLASQLDALVGGFPGGAAVWVGDPSQPQPLYARDPDREIVTASLYKLAVLAEAEREVDARQLSYGDTITIEHEDITEDGSFEAPGTELTLDEALEQMITVSDNGTAVHLARMLGPDKCNALLAASGIQGFHVRLSDHEDNYATARAIGTYFTLLANRKLVSPAASDRMIKRLERQQINDRIPARLPEGTVVAHKTGNLPGLVHDAGIVFTPRGPRVLVVMTWDADDGVASEMIAQLASTVMAAVTAPPAAPRYRVPRDPQYAEIGSTFAVPVTVENVGDEPWSLSGPGKIGLIWELRDAASVVVARSAAALVLGKVAPGQSVAVPVFVTAPAKAGDAKLVVGLADGNGQPLASLGVATAQVPVRIHLPFVAEPDVHIPSLLHRREASLVEVDWTAVAPVRADDHTLTLAWRFIDDPTNRVIAQGQHALGTMRIYQRTGSFFAPLVAPNVRGRYILEYELRERGFIASVTQRQVVEIGPPRTYGDEAGPGPKAAPRPAPRASPTPRPSPSPKP